MQCVEDFFSDLVPGQAQHLAGIFLLAGFFEETVGRAEAQKFLVGRFGIDEPFGNGRAKAADQRMLLDGRNQPELREGVPQAILVERLDGMEADDLGGDALVLQSVRGLDRLGSMLPVESRQTSLPSEIVIALPIAKSAIGPLCTTGSPFLPMRI